jgi:uncharacterized protein
VVSNASGSLEAKAGIAWLSQRTPASTTKGSGLTPSRWQGRLGGAIDLRHLRNKKLRGAMPESRPPFPPFTRDTAVQKVRAAEDAWNSCNPERVSLATPDCYWRNRSEFICGGAEIVAFLKRKWTKELDYRLIKELWAFTESRIAVRFAYEWRDDSGNRFRSYGNENWAFSENGLMHRRLASINDLPIKEAERKFHWDRSGPRPANHAGLSDLDL